MTSSRIEVEELVGRHVSIDIAEPSYYAERKENEFTGQIRRILLGGGASGVRFHFAVVELNRLLSWKGKQVRLISIMARHMGHDILDLALVASLGVNINRGPAWILESSEDDSRLLVGTESEYIGFGVARLIDSSG